MHKLTAALLAVGAVSVGSVVQAEENQTPLLTALSSTVISGYVDTSAHWNLGNGNGFGNPGYAFSGGKDDGFNLNVVKLTIQRPLDEGEWSAGYRVDLLYGPDAVGYNTSFGAAASDFSIKQAYVALRAPVGNGIDFKIGVWDTIIGYEVFEGPNNPNYTRSYGWSIEPTQHTGILASYQINEYIGLSAGVANTLSAGINARAHAPYAGVGPGPGSDFAESESYKAYMASLSLTAPDSFGPLAGGTLYLGVVSGYNAGLVPGGGDQVNYYAGASIPTPIEGLRFGLAYDYVAVDDDDFAPGVTSYSSHIYTLAAYASYQATEKLSFHTRAEYAKFSGDLERLNNPVPVPTAGGAISEEIFALTGTIQYDLWANVLSRLEVRWDHALDGVSTTTGGAGGRPFARSDRNAILVAGNIVYKF